MADGVVTFLLTNVTRLLEDELTLLSGVEDKINSLCNELKFIDIFLKSSEGKCSDKVVKELLCQIRDVAYKAEDVVDTYIANITKHTTRNPLSKLLHFKERFMVLHKVNAEIETIKSRIEEIYKNKERYDIREGEFQSEEAAAAESLRKRRRDVEEEDVVGLVQDSSFVIQQLIMETDSRQTVVSIIGMGGLGKTTLARKIYRNNRVNELFPSRAWGYVSNDYRPRELFLSLLKCLLSTPEYNDLFKKTTDGDGELSEEELKKKVAEVLKGKKYLVVLDDIWETLVWDKVKGCFPDDKTGSRILITSRDKEVAHYIGTTSPYYLPFLNKDESWELFSKKVFRGEECPSNLEPLGRSIVESCGGLPLAIVVLAGVVARKEKSEREWKRMKEVSWHLTQDKTQVMHILKLSYDSLPPRLKPCFLYFGIYPEDYEISARQLIQLWTAEGFIHSQETGASKAELEDIGDYYLDELVDRSLVQVATRRSDDGVKTCRIHDLFRDLCITESRCNKFLDVCTEVNIDALSLNNPRRLSLQCKVGSNICTKKFNQSYTRSLFFFSEAMHTRGIPKSIKNARVLYSKSKGAMSYSLHGAFKTMIHLRYLRIDTGVSHIPASIGNLRNLETLDVRYKETVSSEIWKLKRLRHVYLRGGAKLPEVDRERKECLQTLWLRAFDRKMVFMLNKDMFVNDMFPRLRKLALHYPFHRPSHEQLPPVRLPSLHHLSNLHSLKVIDFLELPPHTNAFPSHLTKITWKQIAVGDEFSLMSALGWLTNLQILKIGRQCSGVLFDLDVGAGEFPQLQVFEMRGMKVRSWRLDKSAMPNLQRLLVEDCEYLNDLPEQLWCLTTLREVHALLPSERLANSLQHVKLTNGCKLIISHAPPSA